MSHKPERNVVDEEELEEQDGELLPDREEMALLNPDPFDPSAASLPVEPRDGT